MNYQAVRAFLQSLGAELSEAVQAVLRDVPLAERIQPDRHSGSDVIYRIDSEVEPLIEERFEQHAAGLGGIVLVAEGIGETEVTCWPKGSSPDDAALRIILDPIDGTRCIMFEKRSAFFLAGAAPNRGEDTRLSDIEVAVMVEIPTTRAALRDECWAIKGQGAFVETVDLRTSDRSKTPISPPPCTSIEGGTVCFSRFFNPGKEVLAQLEEDLIAELFPDAVSGQIITFDDQYTSSGGQLYELLMGHDRLIADLRDGLYRRFEREGRRTGHVCHPYDLAAHLIGSEAGLILCNKDGSALDAPFDTQAPADWIGYANATIQAQVEPALSRLLDRDSLR